jgi:cytochrome c556
MIIVRIWKFDKERQSLVSIIANWSELMIYRRIIMMMSLLLVTATINADSEGIYKYREGVMKAVGGQMASLGASLKGQVFTENLKLHASAMADLADIVPHIFPKGSGSEKSEVLPAVWENPEGFKQRVDDFVSAAKQLKTIAANGDMKAIGGAMQKLGKTCKGCHDDFREEHSH